MELSITSVGLLRDWSRKYYATLNCCGQTRCCQTHSRQSHCLDRDYLHSILSGDVMAGRTETGHAPFLGFNLGMGLPTCVFRTSRNESSIHSLLDPLGALPNQMRRGSEDRDACRRQSGYIHWRGQEVGDSRPILLVEQSWKGNTHVYAIQNRRAPHTDAGNKGRDNQGVKKHKDLMS